eukprot:TRINITY_DN7347_c0_g1_i2.p1 TRINITY_DN7347_c0_g1~~TRINITY_DN7347_c0_g1_i2.p1  ORF type:complete len:1245 (-),score=229.89 TRINITY_DN7347_c0_g1_i2:167-3901(-)
MLLKQVNTSATAAWCPVKGAGPFLACASAAGSSGDFTSSTQSPQLQVLGLSFADAQDRTMPIVGSTDAPDRCHRLVWGRHPGGGGMTDGAFSEGIIATGLANGTVGIYDPSALPSESGRTSLLSLSEKHTGAVQGVDFNPIQPHLLVSGGPNSEILIWDLTNPAAPRSFTPGAKGSQTSDITHIQWNKKVQHILAATAFNGTTVVWDLRAKKAVITFSDPSRKTRCRAMAWSPTEMTQIVTASEEDASPVIQVWDLRNNYSPSRYLEGHTKGIWSLSWSQIDSNLLLSSGKNTEIFCWNMSTGHVQCQVETTNSWNADVQWSPTMPGVLSTCSLEGQVKLFALQDPTPRTGAYQGAAPREYTPPPQWFKRSCGATFGFGGKLVSFNKSSTVIQTRDIVTDAQFVERAERLQNAISSDSCTQYCDEKIATSNGRDQAMWRYIRALFQPNARSSLLDVLDFNIEETLQTVMEFMNQIPERAPEDEKDKEAEKEPEPEEPPHDEQQDDKKGEAEAQETEYEAFGNSGDVSSLFGGGGASLDSSFSPSQEGADQLFGGSDSSVSEDPFAAVYAAQAAATNTSVDLPAEQAAAFLTPIRIPQTIDFDVTKYEEPDAMITRALIVNNFEVAVDCCIKLDRMADALVLATCGGPDLWAKTRDLYIKQRSASFLKLVSALVKDELHVLVQATRLRSWKGTLAVICSYAKSDQFPVLCDLLATRLEEAGDRDSAGLCYIAAGNIDKALTTWARAIRPTQQPDKNAEALVDLIEKVSILRHAMDHKKVTAALANKYGQYANLLAAQGQLKSALGFLSFLTTAAPEERQGESAVLYDRIFHSLGLREQPIAFPFQKVDVRPQQQQQQQPPHQQPVQQQQRQQQPLHSTQPFTQQPSPLYHSTTGGVVPPLQPVYQNAGPSTGVLSRPPIPHTSSITAPPISAVPPVGHHQAPSSTPAPQYAILQPASQGQPPQQPPMPHSGPSYVTNPSRPTGPAGLSTTIDTSKLMGPSGAEPSSAGGLGHVPPYGGAGGGLQQPSPLYSNNQLSLGSAAPVDVLRGLSPSTGPSRMGVVPPAGMGGGIGLGGVGGGMGGAAAPINILSGNPQPSILSPSLPPGSGASPSGSQAGVLGSGGISASAAPTKPVVAEPPPKPTPTEPTPNGAAVIERYRALLEHRAQLVAADRSKAQAVSVAQGKFDALFSQIRTQQIPPSQEACLLEICSLLEKGQRHEALQLFSTSSEQIPSSVRLSLKRLIDL